MNIEYEKIFVNKFIAKNKRQRIQYELSNTKKRKEAVGRFCHNSLNYLDESKLIYSGNSITIQELDSLIKKYTQEKTCYLISWNTDIDGTFLEREVVLSKIIGEGMASIMVFNNLIIIETEQEQGAAIEIKERVHQESRYQSPKSARKSIHRLMDLIRCNATEASHCKWITVTYGEVMTDHKCVYEDGKMVYQETFAIGEGKGGNLVDKRYYKKKNADIQNSQINAML